MRNFNLKIQYQTTTDWVEATAHGLLIAAQAKAQAQGFFQKLAQALDLKMKTVNYSPADKGATLWASIVVGCQHTVEINDRLGAHERAAAAVFGLERFPDQSQINRLLWALEDRHVRQWRAAHLDLLSRHTRAKARTRWLRLADGTRLLAVDLDQRALAVSGKQYELASNGYFGRKRGKLGYQLSAAFIGGGVNEVLDEYFDPGKTPIADRLDDLLGSLAQFCRRTGIKPDQILLRGDAQLGTPATIARLNSHGFHFLFKGRSPNRAQVLAREVGAEPVFWRVENGAERLPRWMGDLGEREHRDESVGSRGQVITARTLLLARQEWAPRGKRPGKITRAKQAAQPRPKVVKLDYYLTDLNERELPVEMVLPTYDDRVTIERYFCDEQYALGAKHVRTKHFAGAAFFQFLVATTNNLLRWLQHSTFRQTEIEQLGLGRLVRQAMQIPARLKRLGKKLIVELPQQHHLVKQLVASWSALAPALVPTAPSDG